MEVQFGKEPKFAFQTGEGELGEYARRYPWTDIFPDPGDRRAIVFKTSLGVLLRAKFPMALFLGKDNHVFYNEPFVSYLPGHGKDSRAFGKSGVDVWPETWEVIRSYIERTLSGEDVTVKTEHHLFINGGGEDGNLEYGCSPVCDEDGIPFAVFVSIKEHAREKISGHDRNGKVAPGSNIEQAQTRARLAIECAGLGHYEVDLLRNEMIASERFNMIWGVQSRSGSDYVKSIHPDDQAVYDTAHQVALKTGDLSCEVRVIQKDGTVRWVKVFGRVLYDDLRSSKVLTGVIQDITAQKNNSDEMSKVVKERTEELQALNEELIATNDDLTEANVNLTRANRDLEQFAYVASHDLQEPLRKIQMFSNILTTDRFSSELSGGASRYLQKITASADRMSSLIKDLLDYARLVNNKSKFSAVDLNTVLNNVLVDYELLIHQKKVSINSQPLPTVEAIPIQMNQLFYNIIGNSLKFIRKGVQPVIAIKSRILDQREVKKFPKLKTSRRYVEITVSDNGIGFSQQYADKIFTIFQQLNEKSTYGGYGIGLSLCQRIVENHYGVIFAAGAENEGASFTFIIPVRIEN